MLKTIRQIGAILLVIFMTFSVYGQESDKYKSAYARFYKAEDLFEKQKYSASQKEFRLFMGEMSDQDHPYFVKARYYEALNALFLYHPDAEILLHQFLVDYPESIYDQSIYFELGNYNYRKRKYEIAIEWYQKMDTYRLEEDQKAEYYFKLGYAYFNEGNSKSARNAFYEVINKTDSKYQAPALYYYSHIAYEEKNYQTALDGFLKLKDNPNFASTVPYYIAQIYYLQGKYDLVIEYAPELAASDNKNSPGMSQLIGDAYYKIGKYDEAVPFLEAYSNSSSTTRDEDYQLGYAYYKSGNYLKAIIWFDKVTKVDDKLAQTALYHIGECYIKQEDYLYARNAYELASTMSFDKEIEEDALYNYAILSYKLDYNPFDEAVEALKLYLQKYPESNRTKDIYQYLINVYTTMKNYKSAIESIEEMPEKDFRMKSAYQMMAYNYGVELYQNAKYLAAIEAFILVKKYPLDPKLNAYALYWIAESHYRMNDFDKAVNNYRLFLEEAGSYSIDIHNDAYYNIGYAYFKQEHWDSAIQSFRTFTQDETETHKAKITDAYLRIGDAYYKKGQDLQAIQFYNEAIQSGGGQADYAKYQIAKSYGYRQDYDKKASTLLDIINNYSQSTFVVPALYELGETYRIMGSAYSDKALQYYNQLIIDYPNHSLVKDAVFQMGTIYLGNKKYKLAEQQFLRILNEFNDDAKKKEAIARLKDVYTALNEPEKYVDLLENYNVNFEEGAKDTLYFDNAYDLYQDSSWTSAIESFNTYLNTFNPPIFKLEALYFKGNAHVKLAQGEEANNTYKQLLSLPHNRFTERAAAFSSQFEYNEGHYQLAAQYYQQLLQSASYEENKSIARIGLMRSYALLNDYQSAKPYAMEVLDDEQALDYVKTESHYVIAKALFESNEYENALPHFELVAIESQAEIGAESQYHVALIYHLQENYSESETQVRALMKSHAGYDYWVAKALILQAKNSMGIEDYVQAEYTLNSVLNGYTITDDGILDEANEVMQVLQSLKNPQKSTHDEPDNTIEINEEGGDNE